MGPCDLSTIVPKSTATVFLILSLLDCYVDIIYVLPNLGTAQGEFHSINIAYRSKSWKDLL